MQSARRSVGRSVVRGSIQSFVCTEREEEVTTSLSGVCCCCCCCCCCCWRPLLLLESGQLIDEIVGRSVVGVSLYSMAIPAVKCIKCITYHKDRWRVGRKQLMRTPRQRERERERARAVQSLSLLFLLFSDLTSRRVSQLIALHHTQAGRQAGRQSTAIVVCPCRQ